MTERERGQERRSLFLCLIVGASEALLQLLHHSVGFGLEAEAEWRSFNGQWGATSRYGKHNFASLSLSLSPNVLPKDPGRSLRNSLAAARPIYVTDKKEPWRLML